MYGEAVKNEHIARVYLTTNPIISQLGPIRNCGNAGRVMALEAEMMRFFQNSQGAQIYWTIVKRDPCGIALWISLHKSVILMRTHHEIFAIREDQSTDRFWVNQESLAYQHPHHRL